MFIADYFKGVNSFDYIEEYKQITEEYTMYNKLSIKFVPRQPMNKNDFFRFEQACKDDPCCWTKDSLGYHYYILPELPIDRPNGTHYR